MSRISVIRNERVVPLLPNRPLNPNPRSPTSGLIIETHKLGSIEVPEHEHASFCLHLQTIGPVDLEWWSEGGYGKEVHRAGTMVFVTPGTRDRVRWHRSSHPVLLSIDESYLLRAARELHKQNRLAFRNRWIFEDRQLQTLIGEFRREMETGWETGALYSEHLGMSLAVTLLQKYSSDTRISPIAKGNISRACLQRVLDYIAENANRDIAMQELATIAGVSRFHFARIFRMQMGVAPYRYLLEQRVQEAKALLRLGTRTVAEIAIDTGFSSAGHFSRAFRRSVGVSPSDWKRQG